MKRSLLLAIVLGSCSPKPATTNDAPRTPPPVATTAPPAPKIVEPTYEKTSATLLADDYAWPPPAPEGAEWQAFDRPWMHEIPGAPKTFYTSSVTPDPKRKAEVQIVALDARQLELDMAIGAEGPFPPDEKTKGKWPRNGGKLPRDPAIATRVVVAFNGAFRLDQNAHGMTIRGRVFAPPVDHAATLLMNDDDRLGFGTWGPDMKIPSGVRSLRQNLDPLLDDGVIYPRGRHRWGGIIKGKNQVGQRAKRSGICRTSGGHLLYLWGDSIEAHDLGMAMKKAGCDYGMHLDMNAVHIGFVFMSYDDAKYEKGKSEALAKNMGITDRRYVHQPSPKEFFYATLRAPVAPDASFLPDGQVQPPPAWLPTILAKSEGSVRTTFIDGKRVRFALTAGHDELDAAGKRLFETKAPPPLEGEDRERVLAAVDLGVAPKKEPLGLIVAGVERVALAPSAASIAIDDEGRLSIVAPGEPVARFHFVAQARALLLDGKSFAAPEDLGLAIGVTARGDLVVAEGPSAAIVESLKRAGCVRIVAPRSGKTRLERAGRDAIASGGSGTRLYVLATKPTGPTYRFDQNADGSLRWPKVKKPLD
jgi:hypothetical protein